MSKIFAKILNDAKVHYYFLCPGCDEIHGIDEKWSFPGGDVEKPTFHPSVLVRHYRGGKEFARCHSFIREGKIQFLGDCSHSLKNQTVDLPDFPKEYKK